MTNETPDNREILKSIADFLSDPQSFEPLKKSFKGKVRFGSFPHDHEILVRTNADETITYGRFNESSGQFEPFTSEEEKVFKERFRFYFFPEQVRSVTPFVPRLVPKE